MSHNEYIYYKNTYAMITYNAINDLYMLWDYETLAIKSV